jgi:hypothetical protein
MACLAGRAWPFAGLSRDFLNAFRRRDLSSWRSTGTDEGVRPSIYFMLARDAKAPLFHENLFAAYG